MENSKVSTLVSSQHDSSSLEVLRFFRRLAFLFLVIWVFAQDQITLRFLLASLVIPASISIPRGVYCVAAAIKYPFSNMPIIEIVFGGWSIITGVLAMWFLIWFVLAFCYFIITVNSFIPDFLSWYLVIGAAAIFAGMGIFKSRKLA